MRLARVRTAAVCLRQCRPPQNKDQAPDSAGPSSACAAGGHVPFSATEDRNGENGVPVPWTGAADARRETGGPPVTSTDDPGRSTGAPVSSTDRGSRVGADPLATNVGADRWAFFVSNVAALYYL